MEILNLLFKISLKKSSRYPISLRTYDGFFLLPSSGRLLLLLTSPMTQAEAVLQYSTMTIWTRRFRNGIYLKSC